MDKWRKYNGDYSKIYYDIKTFDGEVFAHCYPNAGSFNCYEKQMRIDGKTIEYFREAKECLGGGWCSCNNPLFKDSLKK